MATELQVCRDLSEPARRHGSRLVDETIIFSAALLHSAIHLPNPSCVHSAMTTEREAGRDRGRCDQEHAGGGEDGRVARRIGDMAVEEWLWEGSSQPARLDGDKIKALSGRRGAKVGWA